MLSVLYLQVWFEEKPLRVLAGDKVGFVKLNHSFPIPYVNNSQMSADLWQYMLDDDEAPPLQGQLRLFEELLYPYHFSVTVTFKADRPNIFGQLKNASILQMDFGSNMSISTVHPAITKETSKDKIHEIDRTENENIKYLYDGMQANIGTDITNKKSAKLTYIVHDMGHHDHPYDKDKVETPRSTMTPRSTLTLRSTMTPRSTIKPTIVQDTRAIASSVNDVNEPETHEAETTIAMLDSPANGLVPSEVTTESTSQQHSAHTVAIDSDVITHDEVDDISETLQNKNHDTQDEQMEDSNDIPNNVVDTGHGEHSIDTLAKHSKDEHRKMNEIEH